MLAPAVHDDEDVKGERWRLKVLLDAGYPLELASPIAGELRIDLHEAVALVKRGCTPALAFQILY